MKTKQTIIIIGANSQIGSDIAKDLSKGNCKLLLNDKSIDQLTSVLDEILLVYPFADAEIIDCSFEGCWEADIIILAIPAMAEEEVVKKIKEVANQKIVLSISNFTGENQTGLKTSGITLAKALRKMLPHSKVIKAFYTVKREMLITSDDNDALETISELLQTANLHLIKTT